MSNKNLNDYLNAAKEKSGTPVDFNSVLNQNKRKSNFTSSNLGTGEILDYGQNISDTKYLDAGFTRFSPYDAHELQAHTQSNLNKFGTMFLRIANKTLGESAKMPGVIGGIVAGAVGQLSDLFTGEDNTDFVKTAFDNEWIRAINETTEHINKEYLPVYVKKAIETGTLTDKIFTPDFWATEGADGIGYIVSMLVPGTVIGKLGLGTKFSNMLGKTQKAREVLTKIGFAGKAANVKLATLANTLFEAGAEAQGAMETYRNTLAQKLQNGEISEEEYDVLLKEDSVVGANVFGANAAILLGPNYLMSKMMLGAKGMSKMGIKPGADGKLASSLTKPTLKEYSKQFAKGVGTATITEGFWEEGMQSTSENYFVEKQINKENHTDFLSSYMEMLGSTEGQTAIFLGAFLGGGMTGVGNVKETKGRYENSTKLVDQFNKGIESFTDFQKKDLFLTKIVNDQEVLDLDENNKPQINPVKFFEKLQALNGTLNDNLIYQNALAQGNTKLAELMQEKAIAGFVSNFISQGKLGMQILEEYLKDSSIVEEYVKDSENVEKDKKEFIDKILNKAKKMQSSYEMFENFKDVIKLNNPDATEEDYDSFQNKLLNSYLNNSVNIDYYERKLKEVQERKRLFFQNSIYDESVMDGTNEWLKKEILQDERIQKIIEEETEYKKELEKVKKKESDFFKSSNYTAEFNEEVIRNKKIKEETSKEKVEEGEKLISDVNNAQNPEELAKALIKDEENKATEEAKLAEFETLKDVIDIVNENKTDLDVIQSAIDTLKEVEFDSYNVQALITALEYRIKTILKEQEQFDNLLEKIFDDFRISNEKQVAKLTEIETKLSETKKQLEQKQKEFEEKKAKADTFSTKTKSKRGLELRELVKILKEELKTIESTIKNLESQKEETQKELEKIDQDVNNLFKVIDINLKTKFKSFNDLKSYLESKASTLKDHRFNVARLLTQQFYTQQEVESLTNTIESLKNYKDVLNQSIKSLLKDSDPMDGTSSENLAFLNNELNNVLNSIEELENKLFKEQEKLDRINEALKDKLELNLVKEELKALDELMSVSKRRNKSIIFQNLQIQKIITEKKEIIDQQEKEKEEEIKERKQQESDEDQLFIKQLFDNMVVGENSRAIVLTSQQAKTLSKKGFKTGDTVKVIAKNERKKSITLLNVSKDIKQEISLDEYLKNSLSFIFNSSTEGLNDTTETFKPEKLKTNVSTNGTKVMSTKGTGERIEFVDPKVLELERNHKIVKVGKKVTFRINTNAALNPNWTKALEMIQNKDFSDIEFLIKHLPINVVLTDIVKSQLPKESQDKVEEIEAPIHTYYETADKGSETFDKSSRILRTTIIKELQNGTPIENLSTTIEGQYNGELQLEEGNVNNLLQNLNQFGGKIENINPNLFYFVDDKGVLKNINNVPYVTTEKLTPGGVYLLIKTANGNNFPLKINVSKIKPNKAELLYELYRYRFENIEGRPKSTTLTELGESDPALLRKINGNFADELALIRGNNKSADVTIKDIVDFLIWDGTDSINSRVRFGPKNTLLVGDMIFNSESFNTDYGKKQFIDFLVNSKRQHVKFKNPTNNDQSKINFKNRAYVEYLIKQGILSTNAKTEFNEPTFKGNTSMYLDTFGIKININGKDVDSTFNEKRPSIVKQEVPLILDIQKMENKNPALFAKKIKSKENDESKYVDKDGNEYERVSSLKEKTGNVDAGSAVRGTVIDNMIRLFFSNLKTFTRESFNTELLEQLKIENSFKNQNITFEEKAINELFDILNEYKQVFIQRQWSVTTEMPALGGKLGKNIAGTIDLLVWDNINKEYIIIDVKTSTINRRDYYEGVKEDKFYVKGDAIQLNAYRELFRQNLDTVKISKLLILPLTVPKPGKTYNVSTIRKDEKGLFLEVDMSKNIYEILNIKPNTTTKSSTKPTITTKPTIKAETVGEKIENSNNVVEEAVFTKEEIVIVEKEAQKFVEDFNNRLEYVRDRIISFDKKLYFIIPKNRQTGNGPYLYKVTSMKPGSIIENVKLIIEYNEVFTAVKNLPQKPDEETNNYKLRQNTILTFYKNKSVKKEKVVTTVKNKTSTNQSEVDEISDLEYSNFIDNGIVTQNRINSIAEKVKNNEKLTNRELLIFNDKTSEINTILQKLKALENNSKNVRNSENNSVSLPNSQINQNLPPAEIYDDFVPENENSDFLDSFEELEKIKANSTTNVNKTTTVEADSVLNTNTEIEMTEEKATELLFELFSNKEFEQILTGSIYDNIVNSGTLSDLEKLNKIYDITTNSELKSTIKKC
jgi:hypothetical protein